MARIRVGEELGIDMDRVIAWTFVKSHSEQQDLTSSLQVLGYPIPSIKVEERMALLN